MIAIGSDHGGFKLKEEIIENLKNKYEFDDCGTFSLESVDYPEIAYKVAKKVCDKEAECGIVICRTGVGMSISANKIHGIRCALCYNEKVGRLCKEHNNANMIALPADMITADEAINIINNWMEAKFAGGRHEKRVNMINNLEK
jgi:ribose 5-phosphate isomerase B